MVVWNWCSEFQENYPKNLVLSLQFWKLPIEDIKFCIGMPFGIIQNSNEDGKDVLEIKLV